jgi:hypothetical protein
MNMLKMKREGYVTLYATPNPFRLNKIYLIKPNESNANINGSNQ